MEIFKAEIHNDRMKIGEKRQKIFQGDLYLLDKIIRNPPIDLYHPFNMNRVQIEFIKNANINFKNGAHGLNAEISNIDYLYRVCTIGSLAKIEYGWNESIVPLGSPEEMFKSLNEYKRKLKLNWINLSYFLPGLLPHPRNFTFWTSYEISNDLTSILESVFSLGIPSDWKSEFSLILRFKVSDIISSIIKIPSTIDGFNSIIFYPANITYQNKGKTLNLNDSAKFSRGYSEFTCRDLPTRVIEFIPIQIVDNRKIFINDIIFQLKQFYNNKAL